MVRGRRDNGHSLRLFDGIRVANFRDRPNRFLVRCERGGRVIRAFLPNPGRLAELLVPGRRIYVVEENRGKLRKTRYTAVAVEREGLPVMLHTHRTNDVARHLLQHGKVPGLEGARIKASEIKAGRSRFDFLLERGAKRILLEVKSCTLFGKSVAMFPDAVTDRGARHLRELASLADRRTLGAVLFVVHWPHARAFMPDYHTDLAFSHTLLAVRHRIQIIPISVHWRSDLSLDGEPRLLEIPWEYVEQESKDRGTYLLVLYLRRKRSLSIGRLGMLHFPRGFYVYVGSAMRGLEGRIERHRRMRKRPHWHIDTLRAVSELRSGLPIRSATRLECDIARALAKIGEWQVPDFGSTDCSCGTHLFGFTGDPFHRSDFHDILQHFRMDRFEITG